MKWSPEYARGAVAALNETKVINLANATAIGVLEGPAAAKTFISLMNLAIDPLIKKYTDMEVESD
ncbi:TPA: hypothetical protein MH313_15470 [Klebsiella pneumoniae]|uniref:hypothetical protein n=1 Tax=Klebsiella pneumoniae TaxID=573 RepID=UPI0005B6182B|nr:hypothetical protein [Klebsiella pneumoniae]CEN64177.1 Uncharacterised protein [Klebsiella pneumoniae]HBX4364820.1 hypothetical protein [Klebsiella pneumoniae]HBX4398401.1 hypothetical protein [Klebsiella pneumoniae]HBX4403638.1 hypothetical protein [Klebsiella pneumoniae]HBX4408975.1 hypothetical protein [Klebsiella pneumoniae]